VWWRAAVGEQQPERGVATGFVCVAAATEEEGPQRGLVAWLWPQVGKWIVATKPPPIALGGDGNTSKSSALGGDGEVSVVVTSVDVGCSGTPHPHPGLTGGQAIGDPT
jgi:hypothetical protein